MILTGVNTMGKKNVLSFYLVGLFCSMVFSKNDILWDFGVVIREPNPQKSPNTTPRQHIVNEEVFQTKINAVISDPFIPPIRGAFPPDIYDPFVYTLPKHFTEVTLKKNIYQIESMAKKYYIKKKYQHVIELLHPRNLDMLSEKNKSDLEYLLAVAYYHTGDYKKAQEQVLSLLKQNKSDRLYLLIAMIYESLSENNTAKKYYLKLIDQFPNSDYITSAKIKSRILGQN